MEKQGDDFFPFGTRCNKKYIHACATQNVGYLQGNSATKALAQIAHLKEK